MSFLTLLVTLFVISFPAIGRAGMPKADDLFTWEKLPELSQAPQGSFVGVYDATLLVMGGVDGHDRVTDWVSVLEIGQDHWQRGMSLPQPLAYGATVSTDEGVILIGGRDNSGQYSSRVLQVRWDKLAKKLIFLRLPDLPRPRAYCNATIMGETLYVIGGQESGQVKTSVKNFWSLELKTSSDDPMQWQALDPWPNGSVPILSATIVQNNGEHDSLYLLGSRQAKMAPKGSWLPFEQTDIFRYNPLEKNSVGAWLQMASSGPAVTPVVAAPIGQSHILLFASGKDESKRDQIYGLDVLIYHTITNTWVALEPFSEKIFPTHALRWQNKVVLINQTDRTRERAEILLIEPKAPSPNFGGFNYLTLSGYLLAMVLMGVYFSRRSKNTNDFFLAGRRIQGWAAGVSIYATTFSAISYMAAPALVFSRDWLYLFRNIGAMLAIIVVISIFLPLIRSLDITSGYEYLEKRFNVFVRLYGSLVFVCFQLGRMAIVLLLPALALATVTGINVQLCILVMGILSIVYTVMGGIEAVIWTDVLQVFVLAGAAILTLFILIFQIDGGLETVIAIGQADAKFHLVNWSWDYSVACLWVIIMGNFFSGLIPFTSDQSVIQRYLTTPDIKQTRRALWLNVWIMIPNSLLFFMVGTCLYVFYKTHPQLLSPAIKADAILPWFVVQQLPSGICGLVIAGIFAASMSSLDSAMHSVSTVLVTDIYRRFKADARESFCLKLARWLTAIIGILGTVAAMILAAYSLPSLWDVFLKFLGIMGGGLCGVFLLGILTERTSGLGALLGAVVSTLLVIAAQRYTQVHFFLFGAIGIISAMVVGYVASFLIPTPSKNLQGLTLHTLNKRNN